MGRPLPAGDRGSGDRRVLPDGERGRAGRDHAHAAGAAPGPLPDARRHARPVARAVRVRAHRRAARPLPGPHGRHGDLQGRQLLSEPGRADPPPPAGARPRVPDRAGARCRAAATTWSCASRRDRRSTRRRGPALARAGRPAQPHAGDPADGLGEIPRPAGKAVRVVDRRGREPQGSWPDASDPHAKRVAARRRRGRREGGRVGARGAHGWTARRSCTPSSRLGTPSCS